LSEFTTTYKGNTTCRTRHGLKQRDKGIEIEETHVQDKAEVPDHQHIQRQELNAGRLGVQNRQRDTAQLELTSSSPAFRKVTVSRPAPTISLLNLRANPY